MLFSVCLQEAGGCVEITTLPQLRCLCGYCCDQRLSYLRFARVPRRRGFEYLNRGVEVCLLRAIDFTMDCFRTRVVHGVQFGVEVQIRTLVGMPLQEAGGFVEITTYPQLRCLCGYGCDQRLSDSRFARILHRCGFEYLNRGVEVCLLCVFDFSTDCVRARLLDGADFGGEV